MSRVFPDDFSEEEIEQILKQRAETEQKSREIGRRRLAFSGLIAPMSEAQTDPAAFREKVAKQQQGEE